MSVITLSEAEAALAEWQAANLQVARSQSYSFAGRTLTRADAAEIRTQIQYWSGQVALLRSASSGIAQPRVSYARWT